MALGREQGIHFAEHRGISGCICAWTLEKNVFVTQGEGHMKDDHCEFLEIYSATRLSEAAGLVYVFHEWTGLSSYDSPTRMRLTKWSVQHRDAFAEVHLAVRSPIIRMGVQVANVALGGIMKAHAGVATLELELARVLHAVRGR